jgi:hypothetical protein
MTKRTRKPEETWDAIRRQAERAEIERFLKKTPAEVDASLRARGYDPAAVRAEGEAFAKNIQAQQDRLAWQKEAAEGLAKEQARLAARPPKYAGVPHKKLVELVAAARTNPRFGQPVAVLFRNRKAEEASEEELRAILEEIDALTESDE